MQEKELRLALVCFGGISLAVYIHGSTKEILKLARASKAFHNDPDVQAESRKKYIYPNDQLRDKPDTELIYFEILQALSPELDLRVIVDTIAGASAGGMNSIYLGRALAHDMDLDHLRHIWLEEADVSRLVGDKKPAGALDKIFSKPVINFMSRKYLGDTHLAEQVRTKLPALMNIWNLKPPFDGKYLFGLIYDGLTGMGKVGDHSLMPYGHKLDLFVTVTDYYGFRRDIPLNDPPIIHEREHRHKLHFSYHNKQNGDSSAPGHAVGTVDSDFEALDIPALTFAARATACFPGAFPPAQLREVDSFLKGLDKSWVKKDDFLRKNFREYQQAGLNPMLTSFLDGSILNNKPFDQAIHAIQGRPAFREVDRRILYVDPNPENMMIAPAGAPPTLLNTLKGALSDIPMNEPMHDDLTDIQAYNQQIRTIKTVIDNIKPGIEDLVAEISGDKLGAISDARDITYWRIMANIKSVTGAGFSYEGYARLKVRNTVAQLTSLIGDICGQGSGSSGRRRIYSILTSLAFRDKFDFAEYSKKMAGQSRGGLLQWVNGLMQKTVSDGPLPSWGYFLTKFDVKYQRRRLLFVIRDLNTFYGHQPADARKLDALKKALYDILEDIGHCATPEALSARVKQDIRAAFLPTLDLPIDDNVPEHIIQDLLADHHGALTRTLDQLANALNLDQYKAAADQLIADQHNVTWTNDLTRSLALSYIGFSFWDVSTFSIMGSRELGEFDEIKINRISPNDVSLLKDGPDALLLQGAAMGNFGAFFSRADRENDYLWGRLNSAERLIDLLYNQARLSHISHKLDVVSLKKRIFTTILDVEQQHLHQIPDLFRQIRGKIAQL